MNLSSFKQPRLQKVQEGKNVLKQRVLARCLGYARRSAFPSVPLAWCLVSTFGLAQLGFWVLLRLSSHRMSCGTYFSWLCESDSIKWTCIIHTLVHWILGHYVLYTSSERRREIIAVTEITCGPHSGKRSEILLNADLITFFCHSSRIYRPTPIQVHTGTA